MAELDLESSFLLDVEDLYIELGKQISRKSMGMSGSSPEKNRLLGLNWFASQKQKLSSIICPDPRISAFLNDNRPENSIELVV